MEEEPQESASLADGVDVFQIQAARIQVRRVGSKAVHLDAELDVGVGRRNRVRAAGTGVGHVNLGHAVARAGDRRVLSAV